ncbi:transferrin-binding protein-like solute binding protein [Neisseria meningitidis]|uniref:transferrin-binding protein-like solute binding protein n=1 Tax=Neisseria meningitidis TaxID=487 RepID=UPI001321D9D1|nr:transferrin-binding protein-like solute binding protein [Neisseria meningitidis]MCG8962596.1 transferrin-binding protein-like solute binding protein [Neisseria meningitidis]MVZ81196.1 transferrin-binding protein-like solute binding protein [Neisseria meningitidis]
MTIPFKPSLLAMASVLALSACISGGGDAPAVKSSETPSNKVAPPPTDTASPATGADTASPSAGGDGGDSKTEIPPKDTQGEGAPAGTDGGVQNDASQHNDNAPANGTSDTQPENNRDMPVSDAGGEDGGNQDTDAPKNAESLDGTEGNAVSEGTGMPANPPSENAEHTEVATNTEGANPPSEAENSEGAGQGGMQADDGRQDAEEGLQGDDPAAHSPQDQDQQPQNAANNQPKTGVFGEKYFDGTGEITALMIGGETIDLTKADEPVSSNHRGLMSDDFNKVIVSQKQYEHLIYGATKLKDGTYTLFVQGKPTETLPVGNAKYTGNVLHFAGKYKEDWFNHSAYKAAGKFTAEVDFSQKTVTGKIDTKDPSGMGTQNFTAQFDGNNSFKGTWQANEEGKGDISGRFYGEDGAEMAGRYSYKDNNEHKSGFGVFAGKKEAKAR